MTNPSFRVFYSWQDRRPNSVNRGFIEDALKRAVKAIRKDESIEVDFVLDKDTQGVPGSPDIAATIFEKIDNSQAFVADITIVHDEGELEPKLRTPNPNVLVELGYALNTLGWDRIIMVMNTVFGAIELLPFDLPRRLVMGYELNEGDSKEQARASLTKRLESRLRAMVEAEEETIRQRFELELCDPKSRKCFGDAVLLKSRVLLDSPASKERGARGATAFSQEVMFREAAFSMARVDPEAMKAYRKELALFVPLGFVARNMTTEAIHGTRVVVPIPKQEGLRVMNQPPQKPRSRIEVSLSVPVNNPVVQDLADVWELTVSLGKIQPGATVWSIPFWVGSSVETELKLVACVYADNIPQPIEVPLTISVEPEVGWWKESEC